jgi:hypothetical protein
MTNPGLVQSSIRTARVSGPNGHAGGKKWEVIRNMAVSHYHENCVPRNYPSANIVLPLQCKMIDSSPTSMAHRGVWILEKDGSWCFYPQGYAITAY